MSKKRVVFGLIGTRLDAGTKAARWEKWRPTVSLCQQEDMEVDRLEVLYQERHAGTVDQVLADVAAISPGTVTVRHPLVLENPWDLEEVYAQLHDHFLGYPFRPEREEYLVHITTGTHIEQIVLFLLVESRVIPGRLVQSSPGRSLEARAAGRVDVIDLDLSRYDRLARRFQRRRVEGLSALKAGIPTRNAAFNQLIDRIERVATTTDDPLLLLGPTGAGKSQLARRIVELRRAHGRVRGELVDVNCATMRGDGAMSALFGHVKGAFTGATAARPGLLRMADGGVLFLDEIGELGLDEQAMVLRALEEKAYYPVGADREVRSDFQLMAGTNRDLAAEVAAGRFREDLWARIHLWSFHLPGLRERPEDLEPNLDHELEQASRAREHLVTMSREARRRYLEFGTSAAARWTGNFRDLSASVRRLATLCEGGRIGVREVEEELARLVASWESGAPRGAGEALERALGPEAVARLDRFERVQLAEVLRVLGASRSLSEAGRVLFAASRARKRSANDADRLRKYLARFGLDGRALLQGRGREQA